LTTGHAGLLSTSGHSGLCTALSQPGLLRLSWCNAAFLALSN
jgi:hypothetical protein